jgi:hypothetical protein
VLNIPTRVTNLEQKQQEVSDTQIPTRVTDAHIPTRITDTHIPTRVTDDAEQKQEISNTLQSVVIKDRMRRMRELKERMLSSTGIEEIAAEPAYVRNGIEINIETRHSTASTAYATKTTEDGRITENSFFTKNID